MTQQVPFTHVRPSLRIIGPLEAQRLLDTHHANATEETKNRVINLRNYEKILQDMKDGTFRKTYQPIVIGENGIIVDGQHRLKAIVASGCSFEQLVVRDDSFRSAHCFAGDQGLIRGADFIEGIGKVDVALAKIALRLGSNENNPTTGRVKRVWDAIEPEYRLAVGPISNRRGITKASVLIGAVAAGLVTGEYGYVREQLHHMANDNMSSMSTQVGKLWVELLEKYVTNNDKMTIAVLAFAGLSKTRRNNRSLPRNGTFEAAQAEFLSTVRTFL